MESEEIKRPPSFTPAEWEARKRDARRIIWERVLAGLDIHHGDVAGPLGLWPFLGNYHSVLDAVSAEEEAVGGPMVTALVTAIGSEIPGGRFFKLAERLGFEVEDVEEFALAMQRWSVNWICAHPERSWVADAGI